MKLTAITEAMLDRLDQRAAQIETKLSVEAGISGTAPAFTTSNEVQFRQGRHQGWRMAADLLGSITQEIRTEAETADELDDINFDARIFGSEGHVHLCSYIITGLAEDVVNAGNIADQPKMVSVGEASGIAEILVAVSLDLNTMIAEHEATAAHLSHSRRN